MNWEKSKKYFHESWWPIMQPFIESKECDEIYAFLKNRKAKGHTILPFAEDTFRAFRECTYNSLKVVIMGFDPYPQMEGSIPVADGLAFSAKNVKKYPDSLEYFYKGINEDVYPHQDIDADKDLTFLANQGVLLLNVSLSVECERIGSHSKKDLWLPFYEYLFGYFNEHNNGLIYIFLGEEAKKAERYVFPLNAYIYTAHHPSFAARNKEPWHHKNVFSTANTIIRGNLGHLEEIHWDKKYLDQFIKQCPF